MTFIASLKAKNGILQVSDSLELQTGAISRFDDFKTLLDTKGVDEENEEVKLTPKEVWKTFKPERIKNIDGSKKTFRIFDFGCLQVAGSVIINGTEVKNIVKQLIETVMPKLPQTHQQIVDELMIIVKPNFPDREIDEFENPDKRENFPSTDFIYSHYDPNSNEKFFHKLCYSKNGIHKKYIYSDRYECIEDWIYQCSGMVGLAYNFSSINNGNIVKEINFRNGFKILRHAMELAILTEKINYDVPGVGGKIIYSVIDNAGFRFIKTIDELPEDE
jgi:hypothetical protein